MDEIKTGSWREFEVKYTLNSSPAWFGKEKNEVFCELYKNGKFVCKIFLDVSEIKETQN